MENKIFCSCGRLIPRYQLEVAWADLDYPPAFKMRCNMEDLPLWQTPPCHYVLIDVVDEWKFSKRKSGKTGQQITKPWVHPLSSCGKCFLFEFIGVWLCG